MLIVSLVLAGLAMVISVVALSIAVVCDLRDRDGRIRRSQRGALGPLHAARSTLRLWEPPRVTEEAVAIPPVEPLRLLPGPDIVVGRASELAPAADGSAARKAA